MVQIFREKELVSGCDINGLKLNIINFPFFFNYINLCSYVINFFLLVYQLGTCCVYVVFISSNIKKITDLYTPEPTDVRLIMVVILLPLIFLNWVWDAIIIQTFNRCPINLLQITFPLQQIRNLKFLAPFSTFANFVTMLSFGIILYYIFETPFTIDDKEAVGSVRNFPLFFGTVLFALEAIGVVS